MKVDESTTFTPSFTGCTSLHPGDAAWRATLNQAATVYPSPPPSEPLWHDMVAQSYFDRMEMEQMQCKDIPDAPVLAFLAAHGGIGCSAWEAAGDRNVRLSMPAGTPERLAVGKLARLKQRGLVDGCECGCRGDWELTAAGRAALAMKDHP